MLEVLLDNKNGTVWDLSEIVAGVTWKTSRIGKAGSLDLTLIKGGIYQDKSFVVNTGDIIRVRKENTNLFYGYVFEVGFGQDEDLQIKAYDQLRYLLANDTYVFKNITATEVIKRIADDFGLKTGQLGQTGYVIPALVEDNKKLLDIICKSLDLTLIGSANNFVLYDDFGQLTLRKVEDMMIDFYIGDASLMTGFDYVRSIDSDTYNRVKLVQDNKKTGKRETYVAQDSANIGKWGRLQLYQSVDEGLNSAQINQLLNQLISLKNREQKKLRIDAIGDVRVRAGCYVPIVIEELGISQPFLVDECSHKIDGVDHTMTLELKVIG